jgi:CRP/FNR family cyclic AMP-dependent transcriptional regulator
MLERVPMLSNIGRRSCEALEAISQRRQYRKNTVIITEGDETDSLYILLSGRVNAVRSDNSGRQLVISRFQPYDCFGEMSFLDGDPRSATIVTKTPCEVMVIPRNRFLALASDRPEMTWSIILYLLKKLRQATQQIDNLAFLDVYGRLVHFLIENQDENGVISERLTHQNIAEIIGTSRETISRILGELKEGDFISKQNGRIVVQKKLPFKF